MKQDKSAQQLSFSRFLAWEDTSREQVNYKCVYADMAGDQAAGLLLSQIVYWHTPSKSNKSRLRVKKGGHFWIARSNKGWWLETRLTENQVRRCIRILKKRGVIETGVWKFNGKPTVHIRIIPDVFMRVWQEAVEDPCKHWTCATAQMEMCQNTNGNVLQHRTLTETTTETTTQNHPSHTVLCNTTGEDGEPSELDGWMAGGKQPRDEESETRDDERQEQKKGSQQGTAVDMLPTGSSNQRGTTSEARDALTQDETVSEISFDNSAPFAQILASDSGRNVVRLWQCACDMLDVSADELPLLNPAPSAKASRDLKLPLEPVERLETICATVNNYVDKYGMDDAKVEIARRIGAKEVQMRGDDGEQKALGIRCFEYFLYDFRKRLDSPEPKSTLSSMADEDEAAYLARVMGVVDAEGESCG